MANAIPPDSRSLLPVESAVQPNANPRLIWCVCGLLVLAVLVTFGRSITYGFVNLDDNEYVYENPHVLHGLSVNEIVWAFTHKHADFWLPPVWISFMVDSQIYGKWVGGYHLTNVLLHAFTAAGLFLVLRRMTGNIWPSALAAALFAIHPLRTESVVWITERKDMLNGMFFVLTLAAYCAYVSRPFSFVRYLAIIGCFIVSLMAKPITVTLPAVLLLLDVWPLKRIQSFEKGIFTSFRPLVLEKIPLFAVSAIFCAVTLVSAKETLPTEQPPLFARMGEVLLSYAVFLGRMVWPAGLAPAHHNSGELPMAMSVLAASVTVFALTWWAFAVRLRHPYFLIGWLWYLGMLLPVSGILTQGMERHPDRFTYLPQIGLAIAISWGTAAVIGRHPSYRRLGVFVVGLILACLMISACWQTGFWSDNETFWTRSLAITPRNAWARTWLGFTRYEQGRIPEAIEQFQLALQIDPNYDGAHYNMGVVRSKSGQTAQAIDHYRKAISVKPNHAKAHNNLGNALAAVGRFADAIQECREALRIKPDYAEAHFNLGNSLAMTGRSEEALKHFRLAIHNNRDYATAYCSCGNALMDLNRDREAIEHYRQAVQIKPDYAFAHCNLGEALLKANHISEAIEHCEQAIRIKPEFAAAYYNLACCLREQGRRAEAFRNLDQALRLAESTGQTPLAQAARSEILQMRGSKP